MKQDQTSEAVLPEPKKFMDQDTLKEIWDTRGLKYRVDEVHQKLLNRGLQPYVHQVLFRQMIYDMLSGFLVDGEARRDPRRVPMQRFPKVR